MKIVHINTYDISGGAAIAAQRIHEALTQQQVDSKMLVLHQQSDQEKIEAVHSYQYIENDETYFIKEFIQPFYINQSRSDLSQTMFSLSYPGVDISDHPFVQEADVIHLHWTAHFLSPISLNQLFRLNKPLIWTFHDQRVFTGGCHFTAGCDLYKTECNECPQLITDPCHLVLNQFQDQKELYQNNLFKIVTPSQWMKSCAQQSEILKGREVEVIANPIPLSMFEDYDRNQSKKKLGISPETKTLLFVAKDIDEKRKGFDTLIKALKTMSEFPDFKKDMVSALVIGEKKEIINDLPISLKLIPYVSSMDQMREIYRASDLFLLPSLEDNLPNTMLESMATKTPVIAFETGGIPEFVRNDFTGLLAPLEDHDQYANLIWQLLGDDEKRERYGQNAYQEVKEECLPNIQAQKYIKLYEQISAQKVEAKHSFNDGYTRKSIFGSLFNKIYHDVLYESLRRYFQDTEISVNNKCDLLIHKLKYFFRNKIIRLISKNINVILSNSKKNKAMEKYLELKSLKKKKEL